MYACFRHSATGPECGLRSSSVNFGAGELNHRGPFLCICSDERGEARGRALSLPRIQCVTALLGKRTVNTEPLPSSLVTVASPPIMRGHVPVTAYEPTIVNTSLVLPEIAEPFGRKFAISNRTGCSYGRDSVAANEYPHPDWPA